jgi:hypothetical protein
VSRGEARGVTGPGRAEGIRRAGPGGAVHEVEGRGSSGPGGPTWRALSSRPFVQWIGRGGADHGEGEQVGNRARSGAHRRPRRRRGGTDLVHRSIRPVAADLGEPSAVPGVEDRGLCVQSRRTWRSRPRCRGRASRSGKSEFERPSVVGEAEGREGRCSERLRSKPLAPCRTQEEPTGDRIRRRQRSSAKPPRNRGGPGGDHPVNQSLRPRNSSGSVTS